MLPNRDFRHNEDFEWADGGVIEKRSGSTPTATKVKLAGKCSHGYALFFVDNNNFAQHVATPIDSTEIVKHKLACQEGRDFTR